MNAPVVLAVAASLSATACAWGFGDERVRPVVRALVHRAAVLARSTGPPRSGRDALEGAMPFARARREARRRDRCLDELPELIDVVALGLSAGISFDAALGMYCERYQTMLAEELGNAMRSWSLGLTGRREGLERIARTLKVDAFSTFAQTVSESLEFGAPLSGVLAAQAQAVRDARRSMVEERIEKTPVKMIVPTGTLILPAMLLSILGPLVASMAA